MFWMFMMAMDVLIPITMILFGKRFMEKPPKDINWMYGYRTAMSMKNKDAWIFAHQYFGKLWHKWGRVLLPVSILPMLLVIGKDYDTIGSMGGIVCVIQILVMIAAIFPTEAALHRVFDKKGYRRKIEKKEGY